MPVSAEDVKAALAPEVAKQIFAPKPRSLGQSATEGPGSRLQADLVDLAQNTKAKHGEHKYALLVADVFTRKAYSAALRYKDATSVNREFRQILQQVPGKGENAVVTTDQGNEFKGLDAHVLPKFGVHREKDLNAKNDIAVVDRVMQTVKKDLASRVARTGNGWSSELKGVTEAYNERPNAAVHGAPATATEENAQQFFILQDNAAKFLHNKNLSNRRQDAIREAGAFRAPIQGESRSFRPAYSDTVQTLGKISKGAGYVTNTTGKKTLLKQALPVPKESGKPLAHLTTARKNAQPSAPDKSHKPSVAPPPAPAPPPPPPAPVPPPAPKRRGRPPSGKEPNPFFKNLSLAYGVGAAPK